MARGGKRTAVPGDAKGQRTDMNQKVQVAPGGEYGSREQLMAAQRAIPLPNAQASPAPAPNAPVANAGAGTPGPPLDFQRPTERPLEPVTAGLPTGPGPGPEVLGLGGAPDVVGAQLRALYAQYPNDDLLRVLALHDQRQ